MTALQQGHQRAAAARELGIELPLLSVDVYPRDDAERYRLYALEPNGLHVVRGTCADPEALGAMLVRLATERLDEGGLDPEVVAVYDAVEGRWLTSLWQGRS